jgi:two-component system response regulator FixJ
MAPEETVYVVDDGPAMRESLGWLLESVGHRTETFTSAEEFLERFDPERPGCIVLDVRMPRMTGLDLQTELAERGVETPIVFITAYGEVSLAVRACKAGAVDFIEKPFSDQTLLEAIRQALEKDRAARLHRAARAEFEDRTARLTGRERDVMTLVMAGKTNRQIAKTLVLSPRTIEVHRGRLMDKLKVSSVAELVRLGMSGGAVPPADADQPREASDRSRKTA